MELDSAGELWREVMDTYGLSSGPIRDQAFADVVRRYEESHRHYHNLEHIAETFCVLLGREWELKDWKPVYLAVFYHDVIYDPRRNDNEAESAQFAANALRILGLDKRQVERTCQLILWTIDHAAPDDDTDALLFLGADLAILGFSAERYDTYRRAIRREYEWVPDRDFLTGRKRVLEGFLNRPKIYRSKFLANFEEPARHNISAEIAQIDEALRTLPP